MSERIPVSVPHFAGNEARYVRECIESTLVSTYGTFTARFEEAAARWLGVPHAVATINGTAALHVALRVVGVGPGDEVLVPSFTFAAPVNAILYGGAEPVFLDSEPTTGNLDPAQVAAFLDRECRVDADRVIDRATGKTIKAILPVHLYGHPADLGPLLELGRRYRLPVVEDNAESLGAEVRGRKLGAAGEIACLSFNGNKIITSGGGGMVVTNREDWARRVKHLVTLARSDSSEYVHDDVGYNYRMPSLNAALGMAQLEQLDAHLRRKREIFDRYRSAFQGVKGLRFAGETSWARASFWLVNIFLDPPYGKTPAEVSAFLRGEEIETRRLWCPLHLQKPYQGYRRLGVSAGERLYESGLSLPSSVNLTDDQVGRIAALIRKAAG